MPLRGPHIAALDVVMHMLFAAAWQTYYSQQPARSSISSLGLGSPHYTWSLREYTEVSFAQITACVNYAS